MKIHELRSHPERWLHALDHGQLSLLRSALLPASWLWQLGVSLNRIMRPKPALDPSPFTIGVGNQRVGGTGKTPVVADLGRGLKDLGHPVAVLSRGFRAEGGGDEPAWLREEKGLPVFLGADRRDSQRRAAAEGHAPLLLDDALQGARPNLLLALVLDRDLERPPRCLPAGPAREGPAALERADALLVRCESAWPKASDSVEGGAMRFEFRLVPKALIGAEGRILPLAAIGSLGGLALVSGLARPESFEADVRGLSGARVGSSLRFGDHAEFSSADWEEILPRLADSGVILCPEKNLQRLLKYRPDQAPPVMALRSEIEWRGEGPLPWLIGQLEAEA